MVERDRHVGAAEVLMPEADEQPWLPRRRRCWAFQ
jgi:hypothetical protein